jgi:hypothetical protein
LYNPYSVLRNWNMINNIGPNTLILYDSIGENNKMSCHNTCMFADPEREQRSREGEKKQRKSKEKGKKEKKKENNIMRFDRSFLLPSI